MGITEDAYGRRLRKGDTVKATMHLYDFSGSNDPRIRRGEKLKIDRILPGGKLTFTTVSDYFDFESQNFEIVRKRRRRKR